MLTDTLLALPDMKAPCSGNLSDFEGTLAALSPSLAARLSFNSSLSQVNFSLLPAIYDANEQRELACAPSEILMVGAGDPRALALSRSSCNRNTCSFNRATLLIAPRLVQADSRPAMPSQHEPKRSYGSNGCLLWHHDGRCRIDEMQ